MTDNALSTFLRDRRLRLDPATFGFPIGRRRTPGLRREEVAQRANISPTWYTWLEQGRGGSPSADVLDRIAKGLMLTDPERDHLHILAFGHPPEQRYRRPKTITPRLQGVLDALPFSPAIIRTATWDVLAWNRAAALILTDYSKLARENRNILRLIFSDERVRTAQEDWRNVARYVVGAFRADAARAGAGPASSNWSMSSLLPAPNSRPCGMTMRSQACMRASSASTTRFSERSNWSFQALRWRDARIST
ncbi:putative transcriptional regulator [Agrobacterium tumefaciens]|nr:putative transcriptional regulator [Agrobacterium tumefaciens]